MKIFDKYRKLPTQVKATIWFVACQAVQSGCKFLSMPFLVRLLTSEQYGIYSVFLSWLQIITLFATLNLHCGVYNNAMYKFPEQRSSYTAASQSLSVVCTFICLAVYLLFRNAWDSLFGIEPIYTVLIFVQLLFTESFMLWSGRQRYEYRYVSLLIYTALLAVLYMVLPIVAAAIFPQEQRLTAVIVSGVIVQAGIGLGFMIYNYIKGRTFYNREYWGYSLKFNIPLIPHYLSGIVLGQADRVMIKKYIGASEAGIYSFTYNISLVINIITTSINNAIVPYTYEKLKNRDYKKLKKVSVFLLLMVGGMCLAFSAIAPELLKIFATEEYYDAVYLVPVICLSSYFTFLYCLFGNIEFFFEANKFITMASITGAVVNVVLNYVLMPIFGYYAAGYTTLFCYILFSLGHYIFMRIVCKKKLGGDRVYNGTVILLVSVAFVILAFGMMLIYDYPLIRYTLILAVFVVCFVMRERIMSYFKMIKER